MKFLFKPTSYKKGAALAIGATFVWKMVSFVNSLLIALYFGADRQTDVYFYLILLMGMGSGFLLNLHTTVIIPEAMFLNQENKITGQKFLSLWLYIFTAIGLAAAGAGLLWPEQIWSLFSRFETSILAQDKQMLRCGFLLFALQNITSYLTAVAEMYKYFKTAWLSVLNALLPLVFLVALGTRVGIISMVYGFLAAQAVQIVVLLVLLQTQLHWHFAPLWLSLRIRTRQNMLTTQTLAVISIIMSWLPLYLMSNLAAGIVSALTYCRQFTDSASEVFISRTANVAKIQLTEHAAAKQYDLSNQTFLASAYALLALLAPLAVFSCYFAPQIVQIFFQRGQFDTQAASNTVAFLRPMLFTLLLSVPGCLQNSAIIAQRKIKEWFPYALASNLILLGLFAWGIPYWGAFSYPYLMGIGLLIGFVLNAFLFKKHFPFLQYAKQLGLILRFTGWATLALVPTVLLSYQLPADAWVQIIACGTTYVAIYALLLYTAKDLQKLIHVATDNF